MKLVFDNIIYSKEKQGGISNYWYEITSRALIQNPTTSFFENANDRYNYCRSKIDIPDANLIEANSKSDLIARLSTVKFNTDQYFLYHSSFYRPLKSNDRFCEVTTVHDFTHNYYFPYYKKLLHNRLKYSAIKRSMGIICISENTRLDLIKFCPPAKRQKITVIHNGVSDDYFPEVNSFECNQFLQECGIEKDEFILFVGGRAFYKNFDFALEVIKEMTAGKKLVVVGSMFTESEIVKVKKIGENKVVNLCNISNLQLNYLYNNASFLLYPSYYEGFGIPVIEAMKAGCPVIAINKSSIPEISGKAVLLIDELSIGAVKNKLLQLTEQKDEVIEFGFEQAAKFSWDKCFNETYQFYKEVYSES